MTCKNLLVFGAGLCVCSGIFSPALAQSIDTPQAETLDPTERSKQIYDAVKKFGGKCVIVLDWPQPGVYHSGAGKTQHKITFLAGKSIQSNQVGGAKTPVPFLAVQQSQFLMRGIGRKATSHDVGLDGEPNIHTAIQIDPIITGTKDESGNTEVKIRPGKPQIQSYLDKNMPESVKLSYRRTLEIFDDFGILGCQ